MGEHLHAVVVPAARDSAWGSVPRATDRLAGGFPPGTRVERCGRWERRDEKGWLEERRTEADGGDRGNRAADCRWGRGPAAHFPGPSALIRCMGRMKHGAWGALRELVRRTESTGPATR